MRVYEGTLRIRFDATTSRIFLDRGTVDSTFTAADAAEIAVKAVEAATARKAGLCRWSFYIKGVNEGLPPSATQLSPAALVKALKDKTLSAHVVAARFGKPALWLVPAKPERKAVSKFEDIA